MGLDVTQKRASDLLSCFLGENEQNIAAACAEAQDTQSFLIFDEADSLLAEAKSYQFTVRLRSSDRHYREIDGPTDIIRNMKRSNSRVFIQREKLAYGNPVEFDLRGFSEAYRWLEAKCAK